MSHKKPRTVSGELRSVLPRQVFTPATSRLLWMPFHLLSITIAILGIRASIHGEYPQVLALPLSILIGLNFAGLAFLAHETLHGAVTRNKSLRMMVGWLGFAPFCVSPILWTAWHNRVHHGNTNIAGRDPDAYPTVEEYRNNVGTRLALDVAAPRSHKFRGVLTLLIGFCLQALHMLISARKRKYLTASSHRWACLHSLVALGIWGSMAFWMGPLGFLFAYVIPLLIGNSIVMAHIITNHSLSPLTDKNDTLATSLTVTVPVWFNFYTLGFGYHVEHHLFPSMSHRHAPKVREALLKLYPTRYQSMSITRALRLMFQTPRIYKTPHILIDLDTGEEWKTLGFNHNTATLTPHTVGSSAAVGSNGVLINPKIRKIPPQNDAELSPDSGPPPSHAA